jgi:hypothetical protein
MAIVTRASRVLVTDEIIKITNPRVGPGAYDDSINKSMDRGIQKRNYAPFNTTANRSPEDLSGNNKVTPGPGDYLMTLKPREKVIKINNEEIRITEELKPQGVFRSKTNRFQSQKEFTDLPGPGAYDFVEDKFGSNIKKKLRAKRDDDESFSNSKAIVQEILNTRISVPSIPTQQRSYGYYESESKLSNYKFIY